MIDEDNAQTGNKALYKIVAKSCHIAAHTWPPPGDNGKLQPDKNGEMNLEVYSCRPFDLHKVELLLEKYFDPSRIQCTDETHSLAWDWDPRLRGESKVPRG